MIPLNYNSCIQSSTLTDLRSIFLDIRSNTNTLLVQMIRLKYHQVADTLVAKCKNFCKMNILEHPPHLFLKVDEAFCENLRSQMFNWFNFMAIFLPQPCIFTDAHIHSMGEVEPKLGFMANEILRIFETHLSEQPNIVLKSLVNMRRASQVLTDISLTLKLKLSSSKIIEDFQARLQNLLSRFLDKCLPYKNTSISPNTEGLGIIPFNPEFRELINFWSCRYTKNLTISECARHIKLIGTSSLSLMELVNRVHAIQFQYFASTLAFQRFLTFLFKGLIREHDFLDPNQISFSPNLREHLLQKVPIHSDLANVTAIYDYSQHRRSRSGLFLPQIFSTYLRLRHPHLLDNFSLHYTFYDLIRLNSCARYDSISFFLSALNEEDTIELIFFTEIYNRFNEILHVKKLFFKSLFVEKEELFDAFDLFLEELAGLDDPYELLECTKELISFYQKLFILEPTLEPGLLLVSSIWFNPKYLMESSTVQ